jgi:hypothetical protein
MLRQVTLEVGSENSLQDAAKSCGVKLRVTDCKSFNKTGMSLLLELHGDPSSTRSATAAIRKLEGVRDVIEGAEADHTMPLLVVMDRPICRASRDAAIICVDCPLNSEVQPAPWRFIIRRTSDFRNVLSELSSEGIQSKVVDISTLERKAELTGRQREIVATAVAKGYFEFPRKVSLTELSGIVGVKPSTLSEILRSAERRIMEGAMGVAPQESQVSFP